jgi:hypothetical protein
MATPGGAKTHVVQAVAVVLVRPYFVVRDPDQFPTSASIRR